MTEVAIVTGGSKGLGLALTAALVERGWHVVTDARRGDELLAATSPFGATVTAVAGDVTDVAHRRLLVDAATAAGRLTLVVNNASTLGPLPMPRLADATADGLRAVLEVNLVAPLALAQLALAAGATTVVNVTSDAGVEAYEGWGPYGASKAALAHLTRTLAAEHPDRRIVSVDPGDLRTEMHQAAFPDEDISDRPDPSVGAERILAALEPAAVTA